MALRRHQIDRSKVEEQVRALDLHDRVRDRKREAFGTRASGVQIQDAVPARVRCFVRMPAHDDIDARGFRIDVQIVKIVKYVKCLAASLIISVDGNSLAHEP